MPIPVRKIPAQIQLTDDIKRQYPAEAIVKLLIQELANVPELRGNANKILAINNEETAIEFITKPAGSGSATFTLVSDFPVSPTNNQLIFLTQKRGSSDVGFYQYRVSQWVALFIRSSEFNLPVGTQLPSVAVAGSLFFLSTTYLTNSAGVYYRSAGPPLEWVAIATNEDNSALSQSLTALTTRVTTLEGDNPVTDLTLSGNTLTITKKDATTSDLTLPSGGGGVSSWTALDQTPDALTDGSAGQVVALNNSRTLLEFITPSFTSLAQTPNALQPNKAVHTDSTGANLILVDPVTGGIENQDIIYGNTSVKSAIDSDANSETNARTEATTAFNLPASRNNKSVALQTGGLIPVIFPAPTGYYRPYIAIKTSDITNIRIHNLSNDENDTDNWTTTTATLNTIAYTIYVSKNQYGQGRNLEWIVKNYA